MRDMRPHPAIEQLQVWSADLVANKSFFRVGKLEPQAHDMPNFGKVILHGWQHNEDDTTFSADISISTSKHFNADRLVKGEYMFVDSQSGYRLDVFWNAAGAISLNEVDLELIEAITSVSAETPSAPIDLSRKIGAL